VRGIRAVARLFRAAAVGWWNDDVPRLGAALSYYTLFAVAPVLVVAIAIAGLVFGADAVRGNVVAQAQGMIGHNGALAVQALLQGASHEKSGIIATVVGSLTFLVAATGAFLELQTALNTIWGLKADPAIHFVAYLLNRLRALGLVIAIGFLLLVSLMVSAALAALGGWLGARMSGPAPMWEAVNVLVSVAVVTVLFALLFRVLPDVELRWRDVWMGSVVTAVLFTGGKEVIGLYLGRGSVASAYGAAGSVIVLLLWVYYATQIVLFGAEFIKAATTEALGHLPERRRDRHS
jgi:membrane protein